MKRLERLQHVDQPSASNTCPLPYTMYLRLSLRRGESSVSSRLLMYGYASSTSANSGLPDERDALQHADGADDEREVRRDAERVVERDLREVRGDLLEVDVLRAAARERLVEHARQRREDGLESRRPRG